MIKLPKNVRDILKTLTDKGFEAFAVGGCVRDSLAGLKPEDWDIATNAKSEELKELFPDSKVLSEKYSVIRIFKGDEAGGDSLTIDIATFRKDGPYSDGRRPDTVEFVETIEEDLSRRDFTINAMADNGYRFVDLYGGKEDVQSKLVKTIGEPEERFREDPVRMLRAIRFCAELDFDMTKPVFEAIRDNYRLLERVSLERFRRELLAVFGAEYGGKGLNMIVDAGILNLILGDESVKKMSGREKRDLTELCRNMNRSKPIAERRIGLFYSVFSEKKALSSIERLGFEGELRQHLIDVAKDLPAFHFCQHPQSYKKFIYEHETMDRSDYLLNLQKAQRIVFEYDSETKIKSKMYMLEEFKKNHEPIFVSDLAIDADDLIEAGIFSDAADCEKMLKMLVERIHIEPERNKRSELLKLAERYKKHKLIAYFRGISWMR